MSRKQHRCYSCVEWATVEDSLSSELSQFWTLRFISHENLISLQQETIQLWIGAFTNSSGRIRAISTTSMVVTSKI